jgi:hypothetical protein
MSNLFEKSAVSSPLVKSRYRSIIHDSRCEWAHEILLPRRVAILHIGREHLKHCRPCKCCLASSAEWRDVDPKHFRRSK